MSVNYMQISLVEAKQSITRVHEVNVYPCFKWKSRLENWKILIKLFNYSFICLKLSCLLDCFPKFFETMQIEFESSSELFPFFFCVLKSSLDWF